MPAFTRNWLNTTPADADNISAGADEIRNDRQDTQERIDSLLIGYEGVQVPSPPATIANADTIFSTNAEPLIINGDKVDLRGCTYRTQAVVTNSSDITATGTYTLVPNLTFTITPVSSASLLEFFFEGFGSVQTNNGATLELRIRNTTGGGADLGTSYKITRLSAVSLFTSLSFSRHVTGLTGANTFELQVRNTGPAQGLLHGSSQITSVFRFVERV